MTLSQNAVTVLEKRYLVKKPDGALETPGEAFRRVARTLAAADAEFGLSPASVQQTEDEFFRLMWDLDFMPNSPTIANAGARTHQLSACFVAPIEDSLEAIFETIKIQALIHKTGGGTGFSFSRLRPAGATVGGTGGESSGPLSFMDVFNAATESIKQGGVRRGANMAILRIDHPDVTRFISYKDDLSKLTNFNISVAITDAFMDAVQAGTDYALIDPHTQAEVGRLDARAVFDDIVQRAWKTGEPGLWFIDRSNCYCPVPWMGGYEATNPCGEQPLLPFESCNLGSLNLERFVVNDPIDGPSVDWVRFRQAIHSSMHLLDNVIQVNRFPVPELKEMSDATRKIGLGVMGFARMLFKLGIPYGSDAALRLAGRVMSFLDYESKMASVNLAIARGSFPAREGHEEESNAYFARICAERHAAKDRHEAADYDYLARRIAKYGIRNSNTTTIAPTGTISMFADTSSSIEPLFALAFERFQADTRMTEVDRVFLEELDNAGIIGQWQDEVIEGIKAHHGSLVELLASKDAPDRFRAELEALAKVYGVAHDITPEGHVTTQAAFQRFNDSATSKTINFAEEATPEQVAEAYRLAWETGCKGITVYRNNCRTGQPLSTGKKAEEKVVSIQAARETHAETCPACASTIKREAGCESCSNPECGWSACSVA